MNSLDKFLLTNTKEKPFVCTLCNKALLLKQVYTTLLIRLFVIRYAAQTVLKKSFDN